MALILFKQQDLRQLKMTQILLVWFMQKCINRRISDLSNRLQAANFKL